MNYDELLARVMADERYQRGIRWGMPRRGHPEGTIKAHIDELEENLTLIGPRLTATEQAPIRLLIHCHDTFKGDAKSGVSTTNPRNHASLAARFLAEFCKDADLQNMVQFHDEHYAVFRKIKPDGSYDTQRLLNLFATIRDWNTFLPFVIVDGCTRGKTPTPVEWLIAQAEGMVETHVDLSWVVRHSKDPKGHNEAENHQN